MNRLLTETRLPTGASMEIAQGAITAGTTNAIVNAAIERLHHGGGVAWAIRKHDGEVIQQDSDAWVRNHGPVSHSAPAWTSSEKLPGKYVIHAVGPVWGSGDEYRKLADAVHGALNVADQLHLSSISIPAISTGIFGFPVERAAGVILQAIRTYFSTHSSGLRVIRLVVFDSSTAGAFVVKLP
ncbi:MAG: macro domain-containing protein [Chloroflexi bacterium]|nr:macro domain-containing protein [Chloroflexota bacterium]